MDKSKKNCKVIVTANQKVGVGKTTVCVNLGIGLARASKQVCLIDADAQGSMSASLGVQEPDRYVGCNIKSIYRSLTHSKIRLLTPNSTFNI